MWVKTLIFLMLVILVSACSTEEKTIPIVGDVIEEVGQEEPEHGEEILENETIGVVGGEIVEEGINESEEEIEEELPPGTHIVTIKDLKLDPQKLTIKKGDTVIWKHEDKWEQDEATRHYLAAHSNEFRSSIFYFGGTFNHTFNKTGTFTYIDVLYKDKDYMRGEIVVE